MNSENFIITYSFKSVGMANVKRIYLLAVLFLVVSVHAQKTIKPLNDSVFYRIEKGLIRTCLRKDAIGYGFKQAFTPDNYIKRIFYLSNNKPLLKCVIRDTFLLGMNNKPEVIINQAVGDYIEQYESGQRKQECTYDFGVLNGDWRFYNEAGEILVAEKWEYGVWKSGVRFVSGVAQIMSNAYQCEPVFKGGDVAFYKYINKKISSEKLMDRFDIPKGVLINFGINEWGKVEDVKIINGISSDFEKTLVKIFEEMPAWRPGCIEGKTAKFRFTFPFHFRSEDIW